MKEEEDIPSCDEKHQGRMKRYVSNGVGTIPRRYTDSVECERSYRIQVGAPKESALHRCVARESGYPSMEFCR